MKFAFLVMYELRCLKKILKFYEHIIDFYDADIIICCQELKDTTEMVELFDRKVIFSKIYKKPNPSEYYDNNKHFNTKSANWNKESCLQLYINWNEMANVVEQFKDNYDYFINIRTDIDILFPFPDKYLFEIIPKGIYTYDANYAKGWGGFGCGVFMHKDYIIQYLKSTYNVLKNEDICDTFNLSSMNQERFLTKCLNYHGIKMNYVKNLNIIYIAKSETAYTTWAIPKKHYLYDGFIKYPKQVDETFNNLELWNKGYRWIWNDDSLLLSLPNKISIFSPWIGSMMIK